jgi:hypothetical protein
MEYEMGRASRQKLLLREFAMRSVMYMFIICTLPQGRRRWHWPSEQIGQRAVLSANLYKIYNDDEDDDDDDDDDESSSSSSPSP